MPLPALLLAVLLVLFIAVAGGYGGGKLRTRQLQRELDEDQADHEAFDLRLKKLEGRQNRAVQRAAAPADLPPDVQQLLAAASVAQKRPGFRIAASGEETEAEILARAVPEKSK